MTSSESERSVVVLTPWYPTDESPYAGSFVETSASLVAQANDVRVIHLYSVSENETQTPHLERRKDLDILRVPVNVNPDAPRSQVARSHAAVLDVCPPAWELIESADAVHAHVGMPTGYAAARAVPAHTPLIITEHATYLNSIFRDEEAKEMYRSALERANWFLPVSEQLADGLRGGFPGFADRIVASPNPVDLEHLPVREKPVTDLGRWLYLGNFIPRKGVIRTLEAFALAVTVQLAETLDFVGDGPQAAEIQERATELGVADRVRLLPPVPQSAVGQVLADHDLLCHLSAYETFGLTVVEAAASGLAVIAGDGSGPAETLRGADLLGMTRLVDIEAGPEAVVSAAGELAANLAEADPDGLRLMLSHRFSPERVAGLLNHSYLGDYPRLDDGHEPVLHVVAVSWIPPGPDPEPLLTTLSLIAGFGGQCTLVTTRRADWARLPSDVEVIEIKATSGLPILINALELLMLVIPDLLLRLLRKLSVTVQSLRSADVEHPKTVIAGLRARHRERYRQFQLGPVQTLVRWLGIRSLRRALPPLDVVDPMRIDVLLPADESAMPLVDKWMRSNPNIDLRSAFAKPSDLQQWLRYLQATDSGGQKSP